MKHIGPEELALYATADANPERRALIEAHLSTCVQCRNEAAAFASTLDWLRRQATEPGETEIHRAEQRTLERVGAVARRPRFVAWWQFAAGGAVAAAVAVLLFITRGEQKREEAIASTPVRHEAVHKSEAAPVVQPPPVREVRVRRHAQPSRPRLVLVADRRTEPVVQIPTTDPNVKILWLLHDSDEEKQR